MCTNKKIYFVTILSLYISCRYQCTLPPLLVPMLPRGNSQTLVHVTVKEAQDVASYQETCKKRTTEREINGRRRGRRTDKRDFGT